MRAEILCLPALPHMPEQNYLLVLTYTHTSTLPYSPNQLQIHFTCNRLLQHVSLPCKTLSASAV